MQDSPKEPVSLEVKKINRALARTLFRQQWKQENPEGSVEDSKAAYKDVKGDYVKAARKIRKRLAKSGVEMAYVGKPEGDEA